MSTLAEIEAAIEQLPPEQWAEIRRWMDSRPPKAAGNDRAPAPTKAMPDFLARQKAIFGDRILPDSQRILDEMRADRI